MVEQRPLSIGVKNGEDHVLLIDPGPADKSEMAMQSIDENFSGFSAKSPLWYDWGRTAGRIAGRFRVVEWRAKYGTRSNRRSLLTS
jgi:hypothetical protein